MIPRHLLTLADLSPAQINRVLSHALTLKNQSQPWLQHVASAKSTKKLRLPSQSLFLKTVALLFSKRSTRTRVAAETSASMLGGQALFLGVDDIQLGVNESMRDSARVIGGMCQGIFARVGDHSDIEELAAHSPVPVLNALSSLWHPTQVLADLLTLHELAAGARPDWRAPTPAAPSPPTPGLRTRNPFAGLAPLRPLTIAYVGDPANVLHDMLVAYPRLGHTMRVASPPAYRAPAAVWDRLAELGIADAIHWTADPAEAVQGADIVVTDTWISMGQEAEKAERLRAFEGYQITEALCANAAPNWAFMHCLPRKPNEVDDEVFYGPRSIVFPVSDNRKWTIMALFDLLFGRWDLYGENSNWVAPQSADKAN